MKTSICQSCAYFGKVEDPFFPERTICIHYGYNLNGQTITQCRHFKEAERMTETEAWLNDREFFGEDEQ